MTAKSMLLIGSGNSIQEYIKQFCEKNNIDTFDVTHIDLKKTFLKNVQKQSIGIEEIRKLQQISFLKPFKSSYKAIIIGDAELLTVEAQNALLKILEEPPARTIIMLVAPNDQRLLPTIRSRCTIVVLKEEKKEIPQKEIVELVGFFEADGNFSSTHMLKIAQDMSKSKDEALDFIEKTILVARERMLQQIMKSNFDSTFLCKYYTILYSFNSCYTIIKTTNVNTRLALEQLLLRLSTSPGSY